LVPQGSMNSLNPVLRIGRQIADAFADHDLRPDGGEKSDASRRCWARSVCPKMSPECIHTSSRAA